ncbi:short-chain dehydrogenase [Sphingomonas spermidinifaciens]|uniref:Short-chain dehydrogenase n=1 Tax=Sphingomonas spermidinifaciens TaxID=1141889 RepID=A0A2A4B642_9SPHN|nr:SDR family oxidoreductase [Sphingomonas spermidinifaciens]PCD03911.1 short-chain dehydrogenase [Sphingomonas spermidinifaciens]
MARTAVVTGGAQGIGKGLVQHLLAEGWRVAALDLDEEAVAELAAELPDDRLLARTCDVADERAVAAAYKAIDAWQAAAGEGAGIDLIVSNAGLADPVIGPIEEASLADWRRWQDSHVTGAFLMVRGGVPRLRERSGSSIVLIASTRALQSEPFCEGYAAAKGALCAMTHALAVSLGPAIRVNAVLPGWIETGPWQKASARAKPEHRDVDRDQHPVGRVGEPRDIAATVAWLASEGAGFVTGQQIVVDGGMTRRMIYAE